MKYCNIVIFTQIISEELPLRLYIKGNILYFIENNFLYHISSRNITRNPLYLVLKIESESGIRMNFSYFLFSLNK